MVIRHAPCLAELVNSEFTRALITKPTGDALETHPDAISASHHHWLQGDQQSSGLKEIHFRFELE